MSAAPTINIQDLLKDSFELFKKQWQTVYLGFIVVIVTQLLTSFLNNMTDGNAIVGLLMSAINMFVGMGFTIYVLQLVRGQKPDLSVFTSHTGNLLNYFITSIVVGIMTALGMLLLIIPGIYVALRFGFAPFLSADKNSDVGKALEGSTKMTDGIKMQILLFGVVLLVINFLGALPVGLGLLITLPVSWLAGAKLYNQLLTRAEA